MSRPHAVVRQLGADALDRAEGLMLGERADRRRQGAEHLVVADAPAGGLFDDRLQGVRDAAEIDHLLGVTRPAHLRRDFDPRVQHVAGQGDDAGARFGVGDFEDQGLSHGRLPRSRRGARGSGPGSRQ